LLIRPWTGAELLNWRTPGFRPIGDESGGVIKGEKSRPRPRWKYRRWRLRRGSSSTVPPSDHSAPRGASSLSTIANSLPWKSSWRSRACTRARSSAGNCWCPSQCRLVMPNRSDIGGAGARSRARIAWTWFLIRVRCRARCARRASCRRRLRTDHRAARPAAGNPLQQLRQDPGVDLVGRDLRFGDDARLGWVGHHQPAHQWCQQVRDRVAVARRFRIYRSGCMAIWQPATTTSASSSQLCTESIARGTSGVLIGA